MKELAQVCRKYHTLVLADEIYALTTYRIEDFTSMGVVYPEGTFVTGGLSKDRSAGGYRLGVCILPSADGPLMRKAFEKMAATCIPMLLHRFSALLYQLMRKTVK